MAPLAKHVYGVEVVPQAIKDAEDNATKTNLKIRLSNVEKQKMLS